MRFLSFTGLSLLIACNSPSTFQSNCTAAPPGAEALRTPQRTSDGALLPGGRALTPAGRLLEVGGFPIALRLVPNPGGTERYVIATDDAKDDQKLSLVDLQATDPQKAVVSAIDYPIGSGGKHTPGLFYGLALTHDGKRLYVSNGGYDPVDDSQPVPMHYNTISVFDLVGSPPQLVANDALTLKLPCYSSPGHDGTERIPSGIALSADERLLYVATQYDNTLEILSLGAGANYGSEVGRAELPGIGAFDVAVDEASHTAFVSLWGGDSSNSGIVDGVVPVDVSNPSQPMPAALPLETGKAAEAELLLAGQLYVTNADADTLSVVDTASRAVRTMPATRDMILGATPNGVAVDAAAGRIYVADAGANAVVALDAQSLAVVGQLPTAWYPTAVAALADGTVVVATTRGLGGGASDGTADSMPFRRGVIEVIPKPSDGDLKNGDAQVGANLDRPRANQAALTCPSAGTARFPLPAQVGAPSPITHVFFIVKENKSYDSLLGDLPGGAGAPGLVAFGGDNTPNTHALAQKFVLFDNFYLHSELSVQGHEWSTGCIANDYTEKAWQSSDDYGRGYRPPLPWGFASSVSRLAQPGSDSIWIHLDKAHVAYHNYGEVANTAGAAIQADPEYPGIYFNTSIADGKKVDYILSNLNDPNFKLEPFSYISLPNDHTEGTSVGAQTPQSMVAENDEALGRLIDGISRGKWWASSIVFVIEDDPGDMPDHVEEHRSILLVASPWVKRGYKSSVNYDLGSVYHTIELILGVAPMNLNDGHAAALYDAFTTRPDFSPYAYLPRRIPPMTNSADAPLAAESAKIDWSRPDTADITRILWKATHGRDAEPPGWHPDARRDDDD